MRTAALLPLARKLIASERLRHAGIAIALAVLVAVTTILRPLDITVWSLQAKLFDHRPSEDIVFVGVDKAPETKPLAADNRALQRALARLDQAGAQRIFLDLPLRRSNSPTVDAALRAELRALGDKVVLTRAIGPDFDGNDTLRASDPYFAQGLSVVSNDYQTDFLGYVWGIQATYSGDRGELPALWRELVGRSAKSRAIYPDYSIDSSLVPRYDLDLLIASASGPGPAISDKTVIVGPIATGARSVKIPGRGVVPSTMVHILGAETAKRGSGAFVDWWPMVAVFGAALVIGLSVLREKSSRRRFYGVWVGALFALFVVSAMLGIRVLFAETLALGAVFALQRSIVNFKRRHLYLEPRSRLPNFLALQRDLTDDTTDDGIAIVVAKIARLDAIFATLSVAEQGKYLRQLASRLALGDGASTIYYDGGKYFAFAITTGQYPDLQGHLEGLRAVASQSIMVSQRVLDVSMTIGVDQAPGKTVSSRLSSAIAAADQAREAYRPVFVISEVEAETEEWDYSLQARLESALSEDRIAIKLQPQADLRSGRIVGVEALARWVDEERGEIPPARFILQCERVGRLDDLTKRVLFKSLKAVETLGNVECRPRISVNVSAIQFVDSRIADLIERSLALQSADPGQLTIEVTETARIEDFAVARDVFEQVKRLGVRFSMDDFGVASANLEAMFELPFDEIKIDQMFVGHMHASATARAIVTNVARLAADAGLTSVAEGIETREAFTMLAEMGVELGQGFFIARPMTVAELKEMLVLQDDNPRLRSRFG